MPKLNVNTEDVRIRRMRRQPSKLKYKTKHLAFWLNEISILVISLGPFFETSSITVPTNNLWNKIELRTTNYNITTTVGIHTYNTTCIITRIRLL